MGRREWAAKVLQKRFAFCLSVTAGVESLLLSKVFEGYNTVEGAAGGLRLSRDLRRFQRFVPTPSLLTFSLMHSALPLFITISASFLAAWYAVISSLV